MQTHSIQHAAIVTEQEPFYLKYKNLLEAHSITISKISRNDIIQNHPENNYDLYIIDNEQVPLSSQDLKKFVYLHLSPCYIICIGKKTSFPLNNGTLCISLPPQPDQYVFNQIIKLLESINRREKNQLELASMLLHDIRSPLNSLVGYLELLINETFGKLPNGHANLVEKAIDMGDYTLDLVEELSDIFKYEQKFFTIQKEKIIYSEMLDTLLAIIWVKADQKNLKIRRSIPKNLPPIFGDEFQIQRLTSNILSNAIKHAPVNSTISIQVNPLSDKFAQISVSNTGEGVPKDELPHIFGKYYRLQENLSSQSGQGLGLYICRIITEAHGGKIWAENNDPKGLTIHFTLPFKQKL